MVMIWYDNTNNNSTKEKIISIHYYPELLTEKDKVGGVIIESLPIPERKRGYMECLYINPQTKELWYEYEPIPKRELTLEEKVILQEQRIADLELAIAAVLGGAIV